MAGDVRSVGDGARPAIAYSRTKVVAARVLEGVMAVLRPVLARSGGARAVPKGILIVEPFGLGDVVIASALVAPLRAAFPGARIAFVCDTRWRDFASSIEGVDEVFHQRFPWSTGIKRLTFASAMELVRLVRRVRAAGYDLGIDIRGDVRSQALLVAAGCRWRVGFTDYMGTNVRQAGWLLTHRAVCGERPRLEELKSLLDALGVPSPSPLPLSLRRPPAVRAGARGGVPRVGVHVGAGWVFKKWPVANWQALVTRFARAGNVHFVLLGAPTDRAELLAIASAAPEWCEVRITPGVGDMVETIAGLDALVCHDSAPVHIAAGLGVPTVAIFGPGHVRRWGSTGSALRVIEHQARFDCAPCTQLACIHPDRNCVMDIGVSEIAAALDSTLRAVASPRESAG